MSTATTDIGPQAGVPPAPPRVREATASLTVFHLRTSLVIGGVETVLSDWQRHFGASGIDSRLCCFANADGSQASFLTYLADRGQAVTLLPWGPRKSLVAAVRSLVAAVRAAPGEVVIHSHDVRARLVALLAARLTGVPHVASMHAWHNVAGKVRLLEAVDARLLRGADLIANCSEATREGSLARGLDPARSITVYNGLDFEPFRRPVDRGAWRARYGLPADAFVVGNVARLYPEKGQVHLLEAAAALRERYRQLRVVIIGDGPERAALEATRDRLGLQDVVLLPGFEKNFPDSLAMFDVFALPSLAEGAPQVIFGAMARGLPIVACPVDGVAEALRHEVSALLVPPAQPARFAEALARMIDDAALAARLGEAARTDGERRFAVQATTARLAGLYRQLVAARQGGTR